MHFTTLYILKGKSLSDINLGIVEDSFQNKYCYCCGETNPSIREWCDWFKIGGRWNDSGVLKTKKGLFGQNGIGEYGEPTPSICEIADLLEPIDSEYIYAVATEEELFEDQTQINEFIDKINNKEIEGVIALIDCHD